MNLLLTSGGITNESIKSALHDMLGKPFSEAKLCFIPTASVAESGHHDWFVEDLNLVFNLDWKEFDILELNGLPKQMVLSRLKHADVIYVEGGNLYYLAHSIVRSDLAADLLKFLQDKVYVGVSAGSMVFSKYLSNHTAEVLGETDELAVLDGAAVVPPFGLFEWYVKPHLYSPYLTGRDDPWLERIASQLNFPIYAIDDQTALQVVGDKLTVVSEGQWKLVNG